MHFRDLCASFLLRMRRISTSSTLKETFAWPGSFQIDFCFPQHIHQPLPQSYSSLISAQLSRSLSHAPRRIFHCNYRKIIMWHLNPNWNRWPERTHRLRICRKIEKIRKINFLRSFVRARCGVLKRGRCGKERKIAANFPRIIFYAISCSFEKKKFFWSENWNFLWSPLCKKIKFSKKKKKNFWKLLKMQRNWRWANLGRNFFSPTKIFFLSRGPKEKFEILSKKIFFLQSYSNLWEFDFAAFSEGCVSSARPQYSFTGSALDISPPPKIALESFFHRSQKIWRKFCCFFHLLHSDCLEF